MAAQDIDWASATYRRTVLHGGYPIRDSNLCGNIQTESASTEVCRLVVQWDRQMVATV